MPDLNKLSVSALKAAMKTGTTDWGRHGSAHLHALYVEPLPPARRWRMCRCGCRKRASHGVKANGVCLGSGCELRAQRMKRELEQMSHPKGMRSGVDG